VEQAVAYPFLIAQSGANTIGWTDYLESGTDDGTPATVTLTSGQASKQLAAFGLNAWDNEPDAADTVIGAELVAKVRANNTGGECALAIIGHSAPASSDLGSTMDPVPTTGYQYLPVGSEDDLSVWGATVAGYSTAQWRDEGNLQLYIQFENTGGGSVTIELDVFFLRIYYTKGS
jgi:hypothetical protein